MKHPSNQIWALGGFGVWWPDRDLNEQPLTDAEKDYTLHKAEGKAISLWGAVLGQKGSSTRTDLAGGIAGSLSNMGAHQATD